jgi:hypothetical protein
MDHRSIFFIWKVSKKSFDISKVSDNLMTIFIAAAAAVVVEENQNAIWSMFNSIWIDLFVDYYNMELTTWILSRLISLLLLLVVLQHLSASPRHQSFNKDDQGLS